MTTETNTTDLEKLTTQANELRGAMVEALGLAEDNTVRKLGNDLAQVNRQILDIEVTSQGSARDTYRDAIYDAVNEFEMDGLMLSVRFNSNDGVANIVFTPTDNTISAIKAAVASIERPSSAAKWAYTWSEGEDGQADTTLGDAFNTCATVEEKAKLGTLKGGSATNAYKVIVVTNAGYSKK